jgi:hypothetical protein
MSETMSFLVDDCVTLDKMVKILSAAAAAAAAT